MFLGVTHKSLTFSIVSSLALGLIGAFAKGKVSQSGEVFMSSFIFIFVWLLIMGIIFLQEKISDKDYKEVMESKHPSSSDGMEAIFTFAVWLNYWYGVSSVHRYIVLVFSQTLFVGGFYFFIS